MKKMQKGFTLIELMIVVAIIGILAAFALPAYQDYTKRTYVAEGLTLAASAKSAVSEFYASKAYYPANNISAGLASDVSISSVGQNPVQKVTVGTSGVITVTYGTKVAGTGTATITLTPQSSATGGAINWTCAAPAPGGVLAKYLPTQCR